MTNLSLANQAVNRMKIHLDHVLNIRWFTENPDLHTTAERLILLQAELCGLYVMF